MKFLTGYKGSIPLDWNRDGNLIRRGRPNPPRPGSSAGKIGQTQVIGADRVLRDFDSLVQALQQLQRAYGKANFEMIRKEFLKIRKSAEAEMSSLSVKGE